MLLSIPVPIAVVIARIEHWVVVIIDRIIGRILIIPVVVARIPIIPVIGVCVGRIITI